MGIDIGGTFTDAFLVDADGTATSAKAPSSPADPRVGVLNAVDVLARQSKREVEALLASADVICHGTTSTLNALVTGNVAKIGFLTTKGHGDALTIMNLEGRYLGLSREQVQDFLATDKPQPIVARQFVREITERVDRAGDVVVDLNEDEVRAAVRQLISLGVEGIAVSFLWAFRNPAHERRVRQIVAEMDPALPVDISSDVSPRIRELARHTTTIVNAQVAPALRRYLEPLEQDLREGGFGGSLLVMQGSGGAIVASRAPERAVDSVASVLTGGVVGCARLAEQLGHRHIIATDVGGTTFLVGIVRDGRPMFENEMVVNRHRLNIRAVKVEAIGSGGGAIAWIDAGGNLRVGPRSAGASPGPACYGAGGTEPTNTDANLVLGLYDPEFFLGGRLRLSVEAAREALRRAVGDPLGMSVEEAAAAVYAVQNAQTADLIRQVVLESGHDPREFTVYAFGGAGPVYCHAYGRSLGVTEILVPLGPTASAFSAFGLSSSDVRVTAEVSDPRAAPVPAKEIMRNFEALEEEASQRLHEQGVAFERVTLRREIDIRYTMQMAEVATPVANGTIDAASTDAILEEFERRYADLYGESAGFPSAGYQFVTYRVTATGVLPLRARLPEIDVAKSADPGSARHGSRRACVDTRVGFCDTPIYRYGGLLAGHEVVGPAIIEAPTTTVVVGHGQMARVDQLGNIRLVEV